MRIPFVIDNQECTLAEVLRTLLGEWPVQTADIAAACFSTRVTRRNLEASSGKMPA